MEQDRDVGTQSPDADLEKKDRRSDRDTTRLSLQWACLRASIEAMRGLANASAEAFRVLNDELQTTDRMLGRGSGALLDGFLKGNLEFFEQLSQSSGRVVDEFRAARAVVEPMELDYERLAHLVAAEIMKSSHAANDPISNLRTR